MKWIKFFENFDEILKFKEGQLYKLIGNGYNRFISSNREDEITTIELNKIKKMFNDNELYITSDKFIYHKSGKSSKQLLPQVIRKFNDDWWVVILTRNSIASGTLLPIILCDGLEGMQSLVDNMEEIDSYPYLVI